MNEIIIALLSAGAATILSVSVLISALIRSRAKNIELEDYKRKSDLEIQDLSKRSQLEQSEIDRKIIATVSDKFIETTTFIQGLYQQTVQEFMTQTAEWSKIIGANEKEIEILKTRIRDGEIREGEFKSTISRLKTELGIAKTEIEENSKLSEKFSKINESVIALEQEMTKLDNFYRVEIEKREKAEKKLADAEAALEKLKQDNKDLKRQIEMLKSGEQTEVLKKTTPHKK